jgi:DNA helicase HerA-like ATPase
MSDSILIGKGEGGPVSLLLKRANRHGLIAGATGTGKTVTLQGLAEGFSAAGVPVFLADVKGDLGGMAVPGSPLDPKHAMLVRRAADCGITDYAYEGFPVQFWDVFGGQGTPVRATISEMGPLLLSRLMSLNDTQEGVLQIVFKLADEGGLLLLDLKDLRAMLADVAGRAGELTVQYGNVSKATIGTIQRQLLQLEAQGAEQFFGEPALDIDDFMFQDEQNRGQINILDATKLLNSPRLYATFLLWMLSELFEKLPEIGDPDKPVLVFFFDEAHLLFDGAPKVLLDKVEQVVRLVRSKGVGVYFATQNPIDIPDKVASQLGNRVQHALRAFTPKDAEALRKAALTFRANPGVDVASAITELKVGEALVSVLDESGAPTPVERTLIRPPASRIGPLSDDERKVVIAASELDDKYRTPVDRDSAYEMLARKVAAAAAPSPPIAVPGPAPRPAPATVIEKVATSAARAMASSVGRQVATQIGRSLLRGIFGAMGK